MKYTAAKSGKCAGGGSATGTQYTGAARGHSSQLKHTDSTWTRHTHGRRTHTGTAHTRTQHMFMVTARGHSTRSQHLYLEDTAERRLRLARHKVGPHTERVDLVPLVLERV